jgi:hypothetical protein
LSKCLWVILRITFSNNMPVVDKRLIRHRFWGNFGSLLYFNMWLLLSSKTLESGRADGSD